MQNIYTLFLILMPMFAGFVLPKHSRVVPIAEAVLNYLVFVILVVIGIELGVVENLTQKMGQIIIYLCVLLALTLSSGLIALYLFDRCSPCPYYQGLKTQQRTSVNLHGSLLQVFSLFVGFLLGRFLPSSLLPPSITTTVLLMVLLFLVGLLLKNSNISLKEALLNKRGIQISVIFMVSVMVSGAVFSLFFDEVSWQKGVALASGFGWYSLSGTIMTQSYGAVWGSVALFNDLIREIVALILIPYVMRHSSSSAIGLAGVTSLDFTLPILQKSGGTQMVPLIISFGFITNVFSPIFMVFFSSFSG